MHFLRLLRQPLRVLFGNALAFFLIVQKKNKKSVRLTLNRYPQTEPPQLTRPRHPYVTREVLLSAAVFPP